MQSQEKMTLGKPSHTNERVLSKLNELYREAFAHDGFAEIRVDIRILRRRQKEVILHYGKQYRFVVNYDPADDIAGAQPIKPEAGCSESA
ncbi:MAG: hypothetical protein LBG69_05205 [Zoogloeaceae bacterium]|nr:hypothetical protein [Zoogloeaceae bacterium]